MGMKEVMEVESEAGALSLSAEGWRLASQLLPMTRRPLPAPCSIFQTSHPPFQPTFSLSFYHSISDLAPGFNYLP